MGRMKVRYVGVTSDFRGLTEDDLKGWGVAVDLPAVSPLARRYVQDNTWYEGGNRPLDPGRDLVWGPHNGHTLELDVSLDLENLLRQQGHFVLSEVTDSGAEGDQVAAPTDVTHPGDKQVAHVDDNPVQTSETDRDELPDRPDPAWEAMQASEAAKDDEG